MTQFILKIDEDNLNFLSIETDENNLLVNEHEAVLFEVLSSDPEIVDITTLSYNPYPDSEWNGTDFIDTLGREQLDMPPAKSPDRKFAFIVDGKYKFFYGLIDSTENEILIAALSSSPKVIIG